MAYLYGMLIKTSESHFMTQKYALENNVHYLSYGPNKIQFQMHFEELSKRSPTVKVVIMSIIVPTVSVLYMCYIEA